MLVLRRTRGQSVVIGSRAQIVIKILREENGVISLGIKAPQSVQVDRLEIFEKRQINSRIHNDPFISESNNHIDSF